MNLTDALVEAQIEAFKDAHRAIRSLLASVSLLEEAIDGNCNCKVVLDDVRRNLLDNARRYEVPRFYSAWKNAACALALEEVSQQTEGEKEA